MPAASWTGTRKADAFAQACTQVGVSMPGIVLLSRDGKLSLDDGRDKYTTKWPDLGERIHQAPDLQKQRSARSMGVASAGLFSS